MRRYCRCGRHGDLTDQHEIIVRRSRGQSVGHISYMVGERWPVERIASFLAEIEAAQPRGARAILAAREGGLGSIFGPPEGDDA